MITKELGNYLLDIIEVQNFKEYLMRNENNFSSIAYDSFLKSLDIPPKFFKEQPMETQKELIENREVFVQESKKFFGKVIICVKTKEGRILNACRMDKAESEVSYDRLKPIENIKDKFEHRSFMKDGYITYVVGGDLDRDKDNQVLVVDFPILLNKKPVIHDALYTLPNDTFANPIEHIRYLNTFEIELGYDYNTIEEAIEDSREFLNKQLEPTEPKNILREKEVVSLAVTELKILPKSYTDKFANYINDNLKGTLTTHKLESLVLDYDENFKSYKQVTSLRSVSGDSVLALLESETFKNTIEELEKLFADNNEELALA